MNLFIYGTLALKEKQEELGVTFSKIIEYDYIKGKSLIEITDDNQVHHNFTDALEYQRYCGKLSPVTFSSVKAS